MRSDLHNLSTRALLTMSMLGVTQCSTLGFAESFRLTKVEMPPDIHCYVLPVVPKEPGTPRIGGACQMENQSDFLFDNMYVRRVFRTGLRPGEKPREVPYEEVKCGPFHPAFTIDRSGGYRLRETGPKLEPYLVFGVPIRPSGRTPVDTVSDQHWGSLSPDRRYVIVESETERTWGLRLSLDGTNDRTHFIEFFRREKTELPPIGRLTFKVSKGHRYSTYNQLPRWFKEKLFVAPTRIDNTEVVVCVLPN